MFYRISRTYMRKHTNKKINKSTAKKDVFFVSYIKMTYSEKQKHEFHSLPHLNQSHGLTLALTDVVYIPSSRLTVKRFHFA